MSFGGQRGYRSCGDAEAAPARKHMKNAFAGGTRHTTMLRTLHLCGRELFVGGVIWSTFGRNSRPVPLTRDKLGGDTSRRTLGLDRGRMCPKRTQCISKHTLRCFFRTEPVRSAIGARTTIPRSAVA